MRIIRILMIVGLVLAIFGQNKAFAMNVENTNETKINLKNEEKSTLINILAHDDLTSWSLDFFSAKEAEKEALNEENKPAQTEKEKEREKVLTKWKAKQATKWENLPEGKFTINASAYTAAADECGWNTGITASGLTVEENRTVACPPEFPFGAKIKIEGHGTYICEDRGGAIKGNHFDIYMQTKKEAFAFGRKNLLAEIVI